MPVPKVHYQENWAPKHIQPATETNFRQPENAHPTNIKPLSTEEMASFEWEKTVNKEVESERV
ncbi:hypothetical protein [Kingella kingae]|uniref:hypothetical protein n=1 Tax=Kingella kingae TaxID=504 RepID=UPI0004187376|nr:hypothetical protein [Kingella kingae]